MPELRPASCLLAVIAVAACFDLAPAGAAEDLSARIDRRVEEGCRTAGLSPAGEADDGTFLRRASLDLIGRIPTAAEARRFLESDRPEKRGDLVEALIASPAHARNMAAVWRRAWVPQADADGMDRLSEELESWLTARLRRRDGLDRIVRDLIAAPDIPVIGGRAERTPAGFLLANESKAENLAGSTARAFLGLNLSCAQCHDHPFADWSRDQFWELAAFFAPTSPGADRPSIRVAETGRRVSARTPDGAELAWPARARPDRSREVLAGWVASGKNPWFARQAVNTLWSHFFGVGLVGPFDDPSIENPPANAALLDELAREFAASGFDADRLESAIARSRSYRRMSGVAPRSESEGRRFASAAVRNLSGEQLFDSLRTAAGFPPTRDDAELAGLRRERRRFAGAFQVARPAADARTVLQSLTLMNGSIATAATAPGRAPALVAASAPGFRDDDRIDALFLATLTRNPTPHERDAMTAHLAAGGAGRDLEKALADVFWALINSSEFNTNH